MKPWLRSPWLLPAVLAAVFVVLTVSVLAGGPLIALDQHVRATVLARAGTPAWRWLGSSDAPPAQLLVNLGGFKIALPALGAAAVAAALWRRSVRPLVTAAVGVVLLFATVTPLKQLVGRAHPGHVTLPAGHLGAFPSGHTATFAVCSLLAAAVLTAGTAPWLRRLVLALTTLACLAVAAALVWCDYHWLTDVAGGAALAGIIAQVTLRLTRPRDRDTPPAPGQPAAGRRPAKSSRGGSSVLSSVTGWTLKPASASRRSQVSRPNRPSRWVSCTADTVPSASRSR